jgi:hypothetical protein
MGLNELTLEEKRSAIMNVLLIMVADGQYTQEELIFVFDVVAKRIGANKEDAVDIIKNFQKCKYVIPTSVEERRCQLLDMITVMSIDRNIREQEKDACIHIARVMGFNPLKVSEIIAKAEHSISKGRVLEDIALEAKEAVLSESTEKAERSISEECDIKNIIIGMKEAIWKAPRCMTLS